MTCYQPYRTFDDIKTLLNNKTKTFYLIWPKIINLSKTELNMWGVRRVMS